MPSVDFYFKAIILIAIIIIIIATKAEEWRDVYHYLGHNNLALEFLVRFSFVLHIEKGLEQ